MLLQSRDRSHLGDSSRKGEMSSCMAHMAGVMAKRMRHCVGVARGKANRSDMMMPMTRENCVQVPSVPL